MGQSARVLHYTTLGKLAKDIQSSLLPHHTVTKKMKCCEYESISLQDIICFLIPEWAQDTRVLHYNILEMIAADIQSSLLAHCLFIKKMKRCEYESISLQDVILFLIPEWAQDTRVLHYTMLEIIATDIQSSLLAHCLFIKKMKCCKYESLSLQDVICFFNFIMGPGH
jgi:hypothetical protein